MPFMSWTLEKGDSLWHLEFWTVFCQVSQWQLAQTLNYTLYTYITFYIQSIIIKLLIALNNTLLGLAYSQTCWLYQSMSQFLRIKFIIPSLTFADLLPFLQ